MTRTYPARFSVVDPPDFIGLGMTATLAFERPDAEPVAEVPLSRDLPARHAARRVGGRQGRAAPSRSVPSRSRAGATRPR